MSMTTAETFHRLITAISSLPDVSSIGLTGGKRELPEPGGGDIDIFIYCCDMPSMQDRVEVLERLGHLLHDTKPGVLDGGHWGSGDVALINRVEIWLMYFSAAETLSNVDAILKGDYPNRLDNFYYPIGRCAMLRDMFVLYDEDEFLAALKERLAVYPAELSKRLTEYHLHALTDDEDLMRAASRGDVLFYHFALDIALDHFLQALFAINKVYFPSRKRSLELVADFSIKPAACSETILDVIRLGSSAGTLSQANVKWAKLVYDLSALYKANRDEYM